MARWGGQVAKDYVGTYSAVAPNGIEDMCFVLDHLPRNESIKFIKIVGDGGSEWKYKGPYGSFAAYLVREPANSPRAMVYIEPDRVETGRMFFFHVEFEDGSVTEFAAKGGKADSGRRLPGTEAKARWIGANGKDFTGPGPSVGPDGVQDAAIELTNLPKIAQVERVRIETDDKKQIWETGMNPEAHANAELVRDEKDATKGLLYFQPAGALRGRLNVTAFYSNRTQDALKVFAAAGAARPVAPPPVVRLAPSHLSVRWLGQEKGAGEDRGNLRLSVGNVPGKPVIAAAVSDAIGGYWAWRANDKVPFTISQWDQTLKVSAQRGRELELSFPVYRDERETRMTLWLLFEGGQMTSVQFPGQACDPFARGPMPNERKITASATDDLQKLAESYGTIELRPGVYHLDHPLVLSQPVTITGPRQAVLEFAQGGGDGTAWTAAVKIHRSNTTLQGFTVRFATPIQWTMPNGQAPAIIGCTLPGESAPPDGRYNIVIEGMRIEAPPAADPSRPQECPRVLHFASAQSGKILDNELRGGTTEFARGPWIIRGNTYLGPPPGYWVFDVFACRWTHDIVIEKNALKPLADSGKTWRFLVVAHFGLNNQILNNRVEGIGIRDDDPMPNPNAAEITLTEAYSTHFEGRPAAIGEHGRLLQLPFLDAEPARTGDVVTILTGKHAGEWYPIAQSIAPTVLLMDRPLPEGDYDITVSTGFTNLRVEDNYIDSRGGSAAGNLIFVGNHFGTIIRGNHLLGGGAFKLSATPTEHPHIWGWTHGPYVGGIVANNIFEDSLSSALSVEHSEHIKTNRGRLYLTATVENNTFRYSQAFLERHDAPREEGKLVAMTLGDPGSIDPGEMAVTLKNNHVELPAGAAAGETPVLRVRSATVDGKPMTKQLLPLAVKAEPVAGGNP
jgi:hypothetical protein